MDVSFESLGMYLYTGIPTGSRKLVRIEWGVSREAGAHGERGVMGRGNWQGRHRKKPVS